MEKIINRILIVTLAGTAVFLCLAFLFRNAEHDTVASGERSFVRCDYVSVNVTKLPVTVIPYDGEKILVKYENDTPLNFETGDNRLTVSESEKFVVSIFTGNHSDYGITLYLPNEAYREISLYSGEGDIRVGRANCVRMSIITDSGNIFLENTVSMLNVQTTDGTLNIDFDSVADGSQIFSRRGNVNFTIPYKCSIAVDFQSEAGYCSSELWDGVIYGSYKYSLNGGKNLIGVELEEGALTIKEKEQ